MLLRGVVNAAAALIEGASEAKEVRDSGKEAATGAKFAEFQGTMTPEEWAEIKSSKDADRVRELLAKAKQRHTTHKKAGF